LGDRFPNALGGARLVVKRMWRPGKLRFLIGVKNPLPIGRPQLPKNTTPAQSRAGRQIRDVGWGYALPFVTPPETVLILIDARFSSCSPRSSRGWYGTITAEEPWFEDSLCWRETDSNS
jgi:hypothetical protein